MKMLFLTGREISFATGSNPTKYSKHLLLGLDGTTEETSATSSDETGLLSRNGVARDSRSFTNVLVVTSSVRVIDGVHSNTTSLGEVVLLGLSSVEGTTSLEHGLVDTSTTSDDTDGSTGISVDRLLGS